MISKFGRAAELQEYSPQARSIDIIKWEIDKEIDAILFQTEHADLVLKTLPSFFYYGPLK